MERVRLIHWKAEEAEERANRLKDAGYSVTYELPQGRAFFKALSNDPPGAVVIDLARLPSQGRDIALTIRKLGTTRHVPLVFVGGDPKKVARVKELLPDAVYTSWEQIGDALKQAIAHPPEDPVVPKSAFDAYAGRPLVQKLGIKPNSTVGLLGAPEGFEETLGSLPDGAALNDGAKGADDLIIWFTHSREELEGGIAEIAALRDTGGLWIAWPKKASGVETDHSQQVVRETGLAAGLVDYKICSIDSMWSALLFTQRKP